MTPERVKLLADCAALARRLAPESCWRETANGQNCAWYHGFWPYLRLLDYGSSPELHKAFYIDGLADLATADTPARVLVSGAADFAMLEVAREAFQRTMVEPQFTVVDRCETPLALCRWFADQAGFGIETQATDILRYDDPAGFDAIVTHSFLGNIPPEMREALMERWYGLLRPGGRLLTINRIRGREAPAATRFSGEESASFTRRLKEDLHRYAEHLDVPIEQIVSLAEIYLAERRSFPVRTAEELGALLEGAGFTLEVFDRLAGSDPGAPRPSGPTMPGNATYMKVIARRPA